MEKTTFTPDTNLIEMLPNPAFILDGDFNIIHLNAIFSSLMGRSIEELYNQDISTLLTDDFMTEIFKEQLRHFTPVHDVEIEFRGRDSYPTLILSAFKFTSAELETGYCCLAVDASPMKNLFLELEESRRKAEEASLAKSNFLANISHEIRTPLNGVLGCLQLLRNSGLTPRQLELVEQITDSTHAHQAVLTALFDMAQLESGRLTIKHDVFRVRDLVQTLTTHFKPLARDKGLDFSTETDREIAPRLRGDYNRIFRVLATLLDNAVKFTEKGHVCLQVTFDGMHEESCLVKFTVRDSGIGMTSRQREAIFDPFYQADAGATREQGGTGIGLSIARKIVHLMGGELQVFSRPEYGSSFWFVLALETAGEQVGEEAGQETVLTGRHVLVVDDNAINRKVARKILEKNGMRADVAMHGGEAVRLCAQKSYDAVLMDLQMPVMDGFTAARKIIDRNKTIPIIAFTANVLESDEKMAYNCGMKSFLTKPVNEAELVATLSRVIATAPSETDNPVIHF